MLHGGLACVCINGTNMNCMCGAPAHEFRRCHYETAQPKTRPKMQFAIDLVFRFRCAVRHVCGVVWRVISHVYIESELYICAMFVFIVQHMYLLCMYSYCTDMLPRLLYFSTRARLQRISGAIFY